MSPGIPIFIIAILAMSVTITQTAVAAATKGLPIIVHNEKIPSAGAHVTYTITYMETGYKHSVTIFTDKNTKVDLRLPAQFKYGSIVNMTMEETFPYKFKDLGDGEYTALGDAGMETSFDLSPPNVWKLKALSREI